MDSNQPFQPQQPQQPGGNQPNRNDVFGGSQKRKRSKVMAWVVGILIVLALAGAACFAFWHFSSAQDRERLLRDEKRQLEHQLERVKDELKRAKASAEADLDSERVCKEASSELKRDIKAALDDGNTAALAAHLANPVNYVLAASEFGGDISPDEVISSLEYVHSAAEPWDFELAQEVIDSYKAGFYSEYFDGEAYVGKSADGMVVVFGFDCDAKINKIFISPDEATLLSS